jgi:hypothetical protein
VGALNLVVAKDEIAGMDPATFFDLLIGILALFLSLLVPTGWVKRLLIVVFGIALLEFVLLLVSMSLWVRVVVGLVLFTAGVVWVVRATRKSHATRPEHTEKIHAVLDSVETALKNGSPSNLGNSDTVIINKHFPKIAKQIEGWDDKAKDVTDYKQRLRDSIGVELRALGADKPPYNFGIIRDGLYTITEARTADGADSSQPFPPMTGDPSEKPIFTVLNTDSIPVVLLAFDEATGVTGDLVRFERSSDPDGAAQFNERYAKPIYNLLCNMQTWGSATMLNWNRQELEKFPRASLERAVGKKRRKASYQRVQDCPGCT